MKRLLVVLPLLCVAALAAAPSVTPQGTAELNKFLTEAAARGDVPGVAVAVVNKDGLVYHEAFGTMNTAKKVPMGKDTIFNRAAMTTPVTSWRYVVSAAGENDGAAMRVRLKPDTTSNPDATSWSKPDAMSWSKPDATS